MNTTFTCTMCGQCCEGTGGIIMTAFDRERLCAFLGITEETLLKDFAALRNGKVSVRSDEHTGNCVFFQPGKGCGVHPGRPNICRAWPFFRGNIVDAASFELAKDACPGILKNALHKDFAREGREYLKTHQLCSSDPAGPKALDIEL